MRRAVWVRLLPRPLGGTLADEASGEPPAGLEVLATHSEKAGVETARALAGPDFIFGCGTTGTIRLRTK